MSGTGILNLVMEWGPGIVALIYVVWLHHKFLPKMQQDFSCVDSRCETKHCGSHGESGGSQESEIER